MVALRSSRARIPAPPPTGGRPARPLPHDEAAVLVVPHAVLVQSATGWESAWLLACGSGAGGRRYLVQREAAGSSEPEWLADGPVALPVVLPVTLPETVPATQTATGPARLPGPRRP
jgi:hypothetical protein